MLCYGEEGGETNFASCRNTRANRDGESAPLDRAGSTFLLGIHDNDGSGCHVSGARRVVKSRASRRPGEQEAETHGITARLRKSEKEQHREKKRSRKWIVGMISALLEWRRKSRRDQLVPRGCPRAGSVRRTSSVPG